MHHQSSVILFLLLVACAVHAGPCNPDVVPAFVDKSKPYPITPEILTMNNFTNVKISGQLSIQDGCTLVLNNFIYLPDLGQTMIYAVKSDSSSDMNAFPITTVSLPANEGRLPVKFSLDQAKNLSDFNIIKLYSLSTKIVVGSIPLYSLSAVKEQVGGLAGNSASNVGASLAFGVFLVGAMTLTL